MTKTLSNILLVLSLLATTTWAVADGDAARGETLSTSCAACHGADGNSAATNFPKLAGLGENYLFKQLQDVQSGARVIAEMTGILDGLSEQDLWDLAAFYDSKKMQLSGAKEMQVQLNSGEKVAALPLGQKIYRAGNPETGVPSCSGCHSPRGYGNDPAVYPRLSGQHAQYLEKQLRDFRAGNRTNGGEGMIMRKVAENMSDAEIIAVSNYISGLN